MAKKKRGFWDEDSEIDKLIAIKKEILEASRGKRIPEVIRAMIAEIEELEKEAR